jgi:hypothetical protein
MKLAAAQLIKEYKSYIKDLRSKMLNCENDKEKQLIEFKIRDTLSLIKDYKQFL